MTETTHTGRFAIHANVALQGQGDKSHGWPAKVGSFDEALAKAREWKSNAFHFYVNGDTEAGDMYPFINVTGLEAREGTRQCVAVIMERTSVHSQ
jgi:hypothetical protein